jgi:hypothetical protein
MALLMSQLFLQKLHENRSAESCNLELWQICSNQQCMLLFPCYIIKSEVQEIFNTVMEDVKSILLSESDT